MHGEKAKWTWTIAYISSASYRFVLLVPPAGGDELQVSPLNHQSSSSTVSPSTCETPNPPSSCHSHIGHEKGNHGVVRFGHRQQVRWGSCRLCALCTNRVHQCPQVCQGDHSLLEGQGHSRVVHGRTRSRSWTGVGYHEGILWHHAGNHFIVALNRMSVAATTTGTGIRKYPLTASLVECVIEIVVGRTAKEAWKSAQDLDVAPSFVGAHGSVSRYTSSGMWWITSLPLMERFLLTKLPILRSRLHEDTQVRKMAVELEAKVLKNEMMSGAAAHQIVEKFMKGMSTS